MQLFKWIVGVDLVIPKKKPSLRQEFSAKIGARIGGPIAIAVCMSMLAPTAYAITTEHYFPLATGSYWLYAGTNGLDTDITVTRPGPTISGSSTTYFLERQYGGGTLQNTNNWYFSGDLLNGVKLRSMQSIGSDSSTNLQCGPLNPAVTYLPGEVMTGQIFSDSTNMACSDGSGNATTIYMDRTTRIAGIEKIVVSAGTYDALHLDEKITTHYTDATGTYNVVTLEQHDSWFAEDIGEVKRRWTADSTINGAPVGDKQPPTELSLIYTNLTPSTAKNAKKDDGESDCCTGDPINFVSGNHFQSERDYAALGDFPLHLERFYNSRALAYQSFGMNWEHNYASSVVLITDVQPNVALVTRPSGKLYTFSKSSNGWIGDADVSDKLTITMAAGQLSSATYTNARDEIETYDASGKLVSIKNRQGLKQTLSYAYGDKHVTAITDTFGRVLTVNYNIVGNVFFVSNVVDPAGKTIAYGYDALGRLTDVTYQDGKVRKYYYNETDYTQQTDVPQALTRLQDENGSTFALWNYDSNGRTLSSEHALGAEKVVISYNVDGTRTIADALSQSRQFSAQPILGVSKPITLSVACNTCRDGFIANHGYDTNGNHTSRTDFNGIVTTYQYDLARNLQVSRVEASGTPQSRTISTSWHPNYRLPVKIAEPQRLTSYTYDTSGNALSRTVQATSDATGSQGLTPTVIGTPQTWTYTYNKYGQVLTATDPRTDAVYKTTYTYDAKGNLSTITNPVGLVTTLTNYDANGRVGSIVDANGTRTALTYSPRGWLTGKAVTASSTVETTKYGYDGVGQLKQVTLPNNATVSYTYDAAHRMTNIVDNSGNSINYSYDSMGNRLSTQINDPSGALARQSTSVIDTFNRVQQVTGAAQ